MKFIVALFVAMLIAATSPAFAQTNFSKAHKSAPLPAAKPSTSTAATPQLNPLQWLQQFSYADLQNALTDAQGQKPPNITSIPCWSFLLTLVPPPAGSTASTPNPSTSIIQTTPGAASAIQKVLDDETLLLNWFQPNGTLDQLNVACAPLIMKVQAQVVGGGALITAAVAGGPAGTAGLFTGLQTLLGGAAALTALPKL